jgi:hypothetical protein
LSRVSGVAARERRCCSIIIPVERGNTCGLYRWLRVWANGAHWLAVRFVLLRVAMAVVSPSKWS